MIKNFTALLFTFLLFLGFANRASASHMMGADLAYTCLGNDTFKFTLTFYRDCAGITPGSSVSMRISAPSCGINTSLTLNVVINGVEVSPLCPTQILNSSCNGGSLPGVKKYVYEGKIRLTQHCTDYLFYWEDCCRNDAITNVSAPGSTGLRIYATLNNVVSPCDNSPQFTSLPVPYICQNQLINYNHGGYDPDGDSLVYNLVPPQNSGGTPITYKAGWNYKYPLSTPSGTVSFDSTTGQLTLIPSKLEKTCVAIRIDQYRNDTLIGSTSRDIQLVVLNCSNLAPVLDTLTSQFENLSGGKKTAFNRIEVCPGSTVDFDSYFVDYDNNKITISSNVSTVLPTAVFTPSYTSQDSGKCHIKWTPTAIDTGTYVITVTVNDNACPVYGQSVYSYIITVPKSTYAGPDLSICAPATSVQITATGGTKFTWSPATGLSATNIAKPIASPTVTTTYIVTSDLSSLCRNVDTVVVFVLPKINLNPTATPDTVCSGDQVHLFGHITGGTGSTYNITWSSAPAGYSSSVANPFANPTVTTKYYLKVSLGTCNNKDSVTVVTRPIPSSNFNVIPQALCQLNHTNINFLGSTTGLLINWNFDGGSVVSGSGKGPYDVYWNTSGNKNVALSLTDTVQGCTSTTTKVITIYPKPDAFFNCSPLTGCEPLIVNFQNASMNGDSAYSWTFGDGGTSSAKNPSHSYLPGLYDVTLIVESSHGCKDTITKLDLIDVKPVPESDFTISSAGICQNDEKATVVYTGGSTGITFTWTWSGGKILSGSGAGPYDVSWGSTGNKAVTLVTKNSDGCTSTTTKNIVIHQKPDASFTADPTEGCAPLTVEFNNTTPTIDNVQYNWNFGDGSFSTDEDPEHTYDFDGLFDVILVATTSHGCKDTMRIDSMIYAVPTPIAKFTMNAEVGDTFDLSQATIIFKNESQFATHYRWFFDDETSSSEVNPTHKYEKLGVFDITLVAYSINDYCTDTFRLGPIFVLSFDNIFFPNVFSPNATNPFGKNKTFHQLAKKGVVSLTYQVYNRWGNLVYSTNDVNGAWNGMYNGTDAEVGVYTFYARAQMINGSIVEKKGNITLLR